MNVSLGFFMFGEGLNQTIKQHVQQKMQHTSYQHPQPKKPTSATTFRTAEALAFAACVSFLVG